MQTQFTPRKKGKRIYHITIMPQDKETHHKTHALAIFLNKRVLGYAKEYTEGLMSLDL